MGGPWALSSFRAPAREFPPAWCGRYMGCVSTPSLLGPDERSKRSANLRLQKVVKAALSAADRLPLW